MENSILWIVAMIVFIVIECISYQLVSIWMAVGAFFAFLCSLLGFDFFTQFLAFSVLSIISIVLTRPFVKKFINSKTEKTNADSVIGKKAVVINQISNIKNCGTVKINGMEWSARSENDNDIETGRVVRILKIEGVKVIVKEEEN